MKVLDSGHRYELNLLDAEGKSELVFVKREGEGYPFNIGHYGGTTCQEVLRALIDRVKYLDAQISCPENQIILHGLRSALLGFETRASRRHNLNLVITNEEIELLPVCEVCGHIKCRHGIAL